MAVPAGRWPACFVAFSPDFFFFFLLDPEKWFLGFSAVEQERSPRALAVAVQTSLWCLLLTSFSLMLPALDLRPLGFAPLSSYALFTELLLSSQTCKRRRTFVNHFFCSLYSFLAASSAVCQAVALLVAVAALCCCPWRCGLQVGLVAEPGAERCSSGAAAWWVLTNMTWRCEKCSSSVVELWGAAYLGICLWMRRSKRRVPPLEAIPAGCGPRSSGKTSIRAGSCSWRCGCTESMARQPESLVASESAV